MAFATLTARLADGVGVISLNRPDRLNALTPQMAGELVEAAYDFQADGARAILLRAEGRAFCSGTDLAEDGGVDLDDVGAILERHYNPALLKIAALSVPVVAAVQGACAGIGVGLALLADFAIAARSAYFLQAFVNIGLVPDGGASWIVPRLIGRARAAQLMMLGERLPAEQAVEWGLIYKAVDDAVLADEALALARRLANGPTKALGLMRRGLAHAMESDFPQALQRERENQREAGRSADFREGVQAFLAKRPAHFRGE